MIIFQERQLVNVLESVPDNVLVCSNERDKDIKPKPLYNNRKMREFFGGCLVTTKARDYVSRERTVRRQTTFEKRLFSEKEQPWAGPDEEEKAASNEI